MMAINFSTESYDGKQIHYESFDDEQLQYWILWGQSYLNTESYDGKQLQCWILWW